MSTPRWEEPPLTNADDALVEPFVPTASAAAADPPGPPPSSDAPGPVQEPLAQSGSDQQSTPTEFDVRYREPFEGLIYLGYLESTETVWGHRFEIATPSQMEKIQMGVLHSPYVNSIASEIAYQTILVAAYLTSVDGRELPKPVLNDHKENAVKDRFEWVAKNMRPAVIDELFGRCMILESKVGKVLAAMGEAQG